MKIEPRKSFTYSGFAPADKSVTHRAVMLNSIAEGKSVVKNPLFSLDTLATIDCMRKLGAKIEIVDDEIHIEGISEWRQHQVLNTENSGTTMRLLCGLLAGIGTEAVLTGDASLMKRPMNRVIKPLEKLGARIDSINGYAPLTVHAAPLVGTELTLEVPSAQVKSAILLAGLFAEGKTTLRYDTVTRDHTERMLRSMGADLSQKPGEITISPSKLHATDVVVCGDISGAAFLFALGALLGEVTVKNVGINPTRAGILTVLDQFGVCYAVEQEREICGEPIADITVKKSTLKPILLSGELIANIIDEIPVIAVMCCFADGTSEIRDAGELRVKESDRIKLIADNLKGLGANVTELKDGLRIEGNGKLPGDSGFVCDSKGDHRIAMCMAVAAMASERGCEIADFECANVSFPEFGRIINVIEE